MKKGKDLLTKVDNWINHKEKTIVYFPYATYAKDAYCGFNGFAGTKFDKTKVGLYTGRDVQDVSPDIAIAKKQEEKAEDARLAATFKR